MSLVVVALYPFFKKSDLAASLIFSSVFEYCVSNLKIRVQIKFKQLN